MVVFGTARYILTSTTASRNHQSSDTLLLVPTNQNGSQAKGGVTAFCGDVRGLQKPVRAALDVAGVVKTPVELLETLIFRR